MQNATLDEAQVGIKIAGRNINNPRYADDTTLMAESEELTSLSKEPLDESETGEWKVGLKLNIQKTKIMASMMAVDPKWSGWMIWSDCPITSW